MGNARGAATRKWNKKFEPSLFLEALGAELVSGAVGMGRLGSGRTVTAHPGKPGRIVIAMLEPFVSRSFGVRQLDEMREWAASGGTLKREQSRQHLMAAAPELLEALERAHDLMECLFLEHPVLSPDLVHGLKKAKLRARAAIASARGEK